MPDTWLSVCSCNFFINFLCSKDDRLPNLDATQQTVDKESNEETVMATRERKHFPHNITKTGYVIFSVS